MQLTLRPHLYSNGSAKRMHLGIAQVHNFGNSNLQHEMLRAGLCKHSHPDSLCSGALSTHVPLCT